MSNPELESEERDLNFVCLCGGNLVMIREEETTFGDMVIENRKVYKCDKAQPGDNHEEIYECLACRRPSTIWADDGDICGRCFLDYLKRGDNLGPDDLDEIGKWIVTIKENQSWKWN